MTQREESDSVQQLGAFCERLKAAPDWGMPLTIEEQTELRAILRKAVLDVVTAMKEKVGRDPGAHQ